MEKTLINSGNGKYAIMGEFEVGNSGHFVQRILCSGLSKKKALKLMEKI